MDRHTALAKADRIIQIVTDGEQLRASDPTEYGRIAMEVASALGQPEVYATMVAIQAKLLDPFKGSEAGAGTKFRWSYAKLSSFLPQVRLIAAELGASVLHDEAVVDGKRGIRALLVASDGSTLTSFLSYPDGLRDDVQDIGKAVTYLRRYTTANLFGLAFTDDMTDDDGESISGERAPAQTPRAPLSGQREVALNALPNGSVYKVQLVCEKEGWPQPDEIDDARFDRLLAYLKSDKGQSALQALS